MAWLGTDALPITAGWGGPPQLHAAPIGDLVSSILRDRLLREESTKKSIANAIKQFQEQRASKAYLQMAQKARLLPADADLSGFGPYGMKAGDALARLIVHRQEQAARERYMKPYYEALTKRAGREPIGRSSGKIWIPELNGYGTPDQAFQVRSKQAGLLGKQAKEIASEQEDYGLKPDVRPAAHGYVMRDGKMDYARTPEEQAAPTLVSPGDPLTDPNAPTFTPDVYAQREAQSAARQKILARQKEVQAKMLTPPTGDAGGGSGGSGRSIDTLRAQANNAIQGGADSDAVKQRFRELTGQEL
jgi:hypothetical protein